MRIRDYTRGSDGTGEAVRAIVVTQRLPGAATLIVDSVDNFPQKFIATSGFIDPLTGLIDEDEATIFMGHLDGGIIMIDEFAPGYTDMGHEVNQVVVLKPSTRWADAVSDSLYELIQTGNTPPPEPANADLWIDESETNTGLIASLAWNITPSGAVDNSNKVYTVPHNNYLPGSLRVTINGLAQAAVLHYVETTPTNGIFTMDEAPATGDILRVDYQHSIPVGAGNSDTVDGFHANSTPTNNQLLPLDGSGKFPNSVFTGLSTPDTSWHAVGAAGEPAFSSGWGNLGNPWSKAAFRKDAEGFVWLKGCVNAGTVGVGTPIFTLPVGYRPANNEQLRFNCISNNTVGAVNVYSNGQVNLEVGSNAYLFLDPVRFKAEQ